jgi:TonB family protein
MNASLPLLAGLTFCDPKVAKQLHIDDNGRVETVSIVRGNPVLTRPATEAIKKWRYTPFVDEVKPVRVLVPVSITFKL